MAFGSQTPGRKFSVTGFLRNGAWVAADNWSQQILQFVTFLYVGNIIGPSAIGQMTVALTYMLFMHALVSNSFTDVIVQRETVDSEHYDAAFWTSAGLGLLAMLISLLGAPLIAASLGEPIVAPLIRALSPLCLALGLISFFEAKMKREMRFSSLAGRSIVSVGAAFVVAAILAHRGYGVWSLIAYQLVWRAVELVFVASVARWQPHGFAKPKPTLDLLDYSLHMVGIRLVDFFAQNIGRILVGYLFGMHALGIYQLARRFVDAPLGAMSGVFQNLALPIFARLQEEKVALADAVGITVRIASFLVFPAFTGLLLVAPELVSALLKPEWQLAIPLIQILCLASMLLSITYFFGTALLALGEAGLTFRASAALAIGRLGLLGGLVWFGLDGVAVGETLMAMAGLIVWFTLLSREIPVKLRQIIRELMPPLWSTLAMALTVMAFGQLAGGYLAPLPLFAGMTAAGAVGFAATVALTCLKDLTAAARMVRGAGHAR